MIHPMYPSMEWPFDAYCKILDGYTTFLVEFTPTTMQEDIASGEVHKLIYWYPKLVLVLYGFAYEGMDFRGYIEVLSPINLYHFENIFTDTVKKLDTLRERKIKHNHLDEIVVKKTKL